MQKDDHGNRLPGSLLAVYALPTLPLALVILPIGIVLPAFYEAHTTATLTAIGGIAFASRAFDAFTELTPGVFRGIGWTFAFLLPALIILAVVRIPVGQSVSGENPSLKDMVSSFRGNRPMWRFVTAYALWATGNGIFTVLFYIFIKEYMLLGQQFAFLMLAYFGVQVMSMPVWLKTMYRFGKHRSWSISFALQATLPWLILLIEPGASAFMPALALTAVLALVAGGILVVPMALLGDIVDYDILKTGVNRAGNYFAINTLMQKFGMGAGMGIGLPVVAAFGYQSGVDITGWVKFGLIFTYLALPTLFGLSAAAVIWGFPINSRRHSVIRKRIEQRAARQAANASFNSMPFQVGHGK